MYGNLIFYNTITTVPSPISTQPIMDFVVNCSCRNTKPIVDKTGVKCPKCGGDIIARKGNKTKKTFYGCENYPKCDFVAWYKPLKEKYNK